MNYQSFATYNDIPPYYQKPFEPRYDEGSGVPKIDENEMTVQDIYRTPFLFINEHRKNYIDRSSIALKGIQCNSDLSKLYFSDRNVKRIQRMIRKAVYKRTGGQFRLEIDQDNKDILIVMRAIYMEHARFMPNQIVRQVKRLNEKVISEIIPGIITNLRQYYGYLKEINKPLTPIPRPLNVNNAGRRTLPSVSTVLGIY